MEHLKGGPSFRSDGIVAYPLLVVKGNIKWSTLKITQALEVMEL